MLYKNYIAQLNIANLTKVLNQVNYNTIKCMTYITKKKYINKIFYLNK